MSSDLHTKIQLILVAHDILREAVDTKTGNKISHNKLERSRRAHLRHCMDELKSGLHSIPPGTRLTTLVILRSAMDQIKMNRSRNVQLQRSLLRMQKKHETTMDTYRRLSLEVEKIKAEIRRERCSGSECSITTTISEESTCTAADYNNSPSVLIPSSHASSSTLTSFLSLEHSLSASIKPVTTVGNLKSLVDKDSIYKTIVTQNFVPLPVAPSATTLTEANNKMRSIFLVKPAALSNENMRTGYPLA
jgi:hypothetical protein